MQWNPCRQKNKNPVKPRRGDRITKEKSIIGLQILIFNIGGLQIRLNWGIRINNWANVYSWAWISVEWNIMVWQSSTENFVYIYATWNNVDPNKRFEIFWNQELAIWTSGGSYIYFAKKDWTVGYRLWVNTKDPKATLDVKGWIRVSNNCEQKTCTGTNVWTIIYDNQNSRFLGCKKISSSYKRVSLDGWTRSWSSLPYNTNCVLNSYTSMEIENTETINEY